MIGLLTPVENEARDISRSLLRHSDIKTNPLTRLKFAVTYEIKNNTCLVSLKKYINNFIY